MRVAIAHTAVVAAALALGWLPAASAVELHPHADDGPAVSLDLGDTWQRAPADSLEQHRRRPSFVDAATLTVDGERVGVAVLEVVPWGAIGEDVDPGYDAVSLARWVRDSATALSGEPGVELVDSGVLDRDPPLGWIELLRTHASLGGELGLTSPDPDSTRVRQLQVVGLAESGLVQVFVYLPEAAGRLRTRLLDETLPAVAFAPRVEPQPETSAGHDLWFIGMMVAAGALVLLVGVRIFLTLQRRRLRTEANALGRTTTAPDGERPDGETPRAPWEDDL